MQEIQLGNNHIDDHIDMIDYLQASAVAVLERVGKGVGAPSVRRVMLS
jgi:hypothetical protein